MLLFTTFFFTWTNYKTLSMLPVLTRVVTDAPIRTYCNYNSMKKAVMKRLNKR